MPVQHPSMIINGYCMKNSVKAEWGGGQGDSGWTSTLKLPANGSFVETSGSGQNKKDACKAASEEMLRELHKIGALNDIKFAAETVAALGPSSGEPAAKRQRTEAPAAAAKPAASPAAASPLAKTLAATTGPPGLKAVPQGLHPQGLQGTPQGLQGTPAGLKGTPQGLKGQPQGLLSTPQALTLQKAPVASGTAGRDHLKPAGLAPGKGLVAGALRPGKVNTEAVPAAARHLIQGVAMQKVSASEVNKTEQIPGETYGYNLATSRMKLNEYLSRRGISTDYPTESVGGGGFVASVCFKPLRGTEMYKRTAYAQKKQDALNKLALLTCVDLVKRGEMPPYSNKRTADGMVAPEVELPAPLESEMEELLSGMNLTQGFNNYEALTEPARLQADFEAADYAVASDKIASITWEPPVWGKSPWTDRPMSKWDAKLSEEETAAKLLTQLEEKEHAHWNQWVKETRAKLPASQMGDEIVASVATSPVVMISGSTGCGKTTQVPQLLLENAIRSGMATKMNIVVTQPRRIAAITVAERVAQERGESLGESVGYSVRFAQILPRGHASICFMTTGSLLKRMTTRGLNGVTHIIIDEVHERDLYSDFLVTIVRQLLRANAGLKVVLMSATINLGKWQEYFGSRLGFPIEIPGRLHPVTTYFLEDVVNFTGTLKAEVKKGQEEDVSPDLVATLVAYVALLSMGDDYGAILVFLPGWETIEAVHKLLRRADSANAMYIIPLHSQVPKESQQQAFNPAPWGKIKVILSTNIAESSVTIEDVVYVVDSCRVKQLVPTTSAGGRQAYRLSNTPASKSSLQQRAGRAGRVRPGYCYRLISRKIFDLLPEDLQPEMVRMPLHQVTLTLKALNLGSAAAFLSLAPDPPPKQSVLVAVATLQDLKALDGNENITSLGMKLAELPIEPRMGVGILAACMLGVAEPVVMLGTLIGSPPIFVDKAKGAQNACMDLPDVERLQRIGSDHYTQLRIIYGLFNVDEWTLPGACHKLRLEYSVVRGLLEAIQQTLGMLKQMGAIKSSNVGESKAWLSRLGSDNETADDKRKWALTSFLLGIGLEHFGVRVAFSRKIWLGQGVQGTIPPSAAVQDSGANFDPDRPCCVFADMRATDWKTNCKEVTALSSPSAMIGAAREISYDPSSGCTYLDGWAPLRMKYDTACRLTAMQQALRVCLLMVTRDRGWSMEGMPLVDQFVKLMGDLAVAPAAPR
eukprot:TRINITY_DN17692_c0_g1_i1.p1 TRINITY_DN17692_c0_g1~~TRINITY_DN17692_c0_g1_i1.p1  ORF type:complete len:1207 (-),score=325.75 TRINITY_DN17692_c0_g1_i1:212-3832(-)